MFDFEIINNHYLTTWLDMIVLQCTNTWTTNKSYNVSLLLKDILILSVLGYEKSAMGIWHCYIIMYISLSHLRVSTCWNEADVLC